MADLSNPLTQVVVGQEQPAVTVNNLIDALSPAAVYGQNDLTTSGLTFGYYGGRYRGIAIAHSTIALPASQANIYIVAAKATGVVSQSTSTTNWNDATNYDRLFWAMTGASTIEDWDDFREVIASAGAGAAGSVGTDAIWDAKGDLAVATGSDAASRLAVGSNGQVLTADSAEATGTKWAAVSRTPSIQSVASAATVTPTFSDDIVLITAQAAGLTLANPTGTAIDSLGMVIRIRDNGTARSIAYGSEYRAIGVTLPTTTVISKTIYLAMIWNATDTRMDVIAVGQEA